MRAHCHERTHSHGWTADLEHVASHNAGSAAVVEAALGDSERAALEGPDIAVPQVAVEVTC